MCVRLCFATVAGYVVSTACLALAQLTGGIMSDRDKAGLRGPVKAVVTERTFAGVDGGQPRKTTTTSEYARDGRILEVRYGNPDGSEWTTRYTYHSDGRLLKTVSSKPDSPPSSETVYSYDDAKRLIAVKSGEHIQLRYEYDDKGQKSATESYDSKPLSPNTAYAPHWEGTDLGFAPLPGGTLITLYNEQGVATGAQLHDGNGKLVAHIVRKFDEKGRVLAEEQVADAPELMVPEELRSTLNAEQLRSMGAFIAGGLHNRAITYSYDDHGRVTKRRRTGGAFGEEVTITTYNEHGDKATEHTTTVTNPEVRREYGLTEAGTLLPVGPTPAAEPPATYETQYSYQYDIYGNWTEQTTLSRTRQDAELEPNKIHRKLTYY